MKDTTIDRSRRTDWRPFDSSFLAFRVRVILRRRAYRQMARGYRPTLPKVRRIGPRFPYTFVNRLEATTDTRDAGT